MMWLLTSKWLLPLSLGVEGLIVMILLERVLIHPEESLTFRLGLVIGAWMVGLSILGCKFLSNL